MKSFIFGTWNVRTLLDNAQANRPERRTALVGRELARYKVDIAALSETRLAEEGQLKETGAFSGVGEPKTTAAKLALALQ